MRCHDCEGAAELNEAPGSTFELEHFDKQGTVVMHGISVTTCPTCGARCPVIPGMKRLIDLVATGVREATWDGGQWLPTSK